MKKFLHQNVDGYESISISTPTEEKWLTAITEDSSNGKSIIVTVEHGDENNKVFWQDLILAKEKDGFYEVLVYNNVLTEDWMVQYLIEEDFNQMPIVHSPSVMDDVMRKKINGEKNLATFINEGGEIIIGVMSGETWKQTLAKVRVSADAPSQYEVIVYHRKMRYPNDRMESPNPVDIYVIPEYEDEDTPCM